MADENLLYSGSPDAVILQGFHWKSCEHPWYQILAHNAAKIKNAGFDCIWLPPPAASADKQGYLPTQWYNLDSAYGSQKELVKAIKTLLPVKAIADIVANHRCGCRDWADFCNPHFADKNETDPDKIRLANEKAVASTDEWKQRGGTPKGRPDTGDTFDGARDLDHTNPLVQKAIINWLAMLKNEIGFAGWRWDLVKGYHPRFVGMYNDASKPEFSVAEYADSSNQAVADWLNRTFGKDDLPDGSPDRIGAKTCAFDFPTRGLLKQAFGDKDFGRLKTIDGKPAGLIGAWPKAAVTFIENHDSEPANHDDPFPTDFVPAGYAYLLTHPGKPCVFWPHLFDWPDPMPQTIKKLIKIRKSAGLSAGSAVNIIAAEKGLYAAITDDKLAVKLGPAPWNPPAKEWKTTCTGHDFAVWTRP